MICGLVAGLPRPYLELKKGSKVGIAGKLHYSSWEKEGQKRSKVDITANAIDYPPKPKQQAADDDIPF